MEQTTIDAPLGEPLAVPCRVRAVPRNHQVTGTSWTKWPSETHAEQRTRRSRRHQAGDPGSAGVVTGSELRIGSIGERDDGLYRCSVSLSPSSSNEVDVSDSNSTGDPEPARHLVRHGDFVRVRVQGAPFHSSSSLYLSRSPDVRRWTHLVRRAGDWPVEQRHFFRVGVLIQSWAFAGTRAGIYGQLRAASREKLRPDIRGTRFD